MRVEQKAEKIYQDLISEYSLKYDVASNKRDYSFDWKSVYESLPGGDFGG